MRGHSFFLRQFVMLVVVHAALPSGHLSSLRPWPSSPMPPSHGPASFSLLPSTEAPSVRHARHWLCLRLLQIVTMGTHGVALALLTVVLLEAIIPVSAVDGLARVVQEAHEFLIKIRSGHPPISTITCTCWRNDSICFSLLAISCSLICPSDIQLFHVPK